MRFFKTDDVVIHYAFHAGNADCCPIVFLNSLGTDFRIWDAVARKLPAEIPVLRMDKRGHGLSDLGAIDIPTLAGDAIALMDHVGIASALICGVSVGGLIAQEIAVSRPDRARGLVLSNTGSKIGSDEIWNPRIDAVMTHGIEPIADAVLERWFAKSFRENAPAETAGYRNMLCRTTAEGYAGTCAAIRDADLTAAIASIAVPTACISGSEDLATPPDLLTRLAETIPGARHVPINGVGHLPSIEAPDSVARIVYDVWAEL